MVYTDRERLEWYFKQNVHSLTTKQLEHYAYLLELRLWELDRERHPNKPIPIQGTLGLAE